MVTLAEFKKMVDDHDLTYQYSDDGSVWRRGQDQFNRISKAAEELPLEDVKRIWNAKCDRSLVADEAPRWYWK